MFKAPDYPCAVCQRDSKHCSDLCFKWELWFRNNWRRLQHIYLKTKEDDK